MQRRVALNCLAGCASKHSAKVHASGGTAEHNRDLHGARAARSAVLQLAMWLQRSAALAILEIAVRPWTEFLKEMALAIACAMRAARCCHGSDYHRHVTRAVVQTASGDAAVRVWLHGRCQVHE